MRRVSAEGGRFPFDFDQRYQGELFPDQLGAGVVAQGLLVAAGRKPASGPAPAGGRTGTSSLGLK